VKKQDIEKGKLYVVDTPGAEAGRPSSYGEATWKITAEAVEVGVTREHSSRLDGVRARLAEEFRRTYGTAHDVVETLPVGFEYVVSTAQVDRPVESHDEERIVQARVARYELMGRIAAALTALGASPKIGKRFGEFEVYMTAEQVTFSAEFFDRWIARIDPARIVEQAFAEVDRMRPRDDEEYQAARAEVIDGIREELRVPGAVPGAGAETE
jgi:hypothetical protein